MYFDRIERGVVEQTIASIYERVESLEDIQFLIKYASQVRGDWMGRQSKVVILSEQSVTGGA